MLRFILSWHWNHLKIIKYASPEWVQMLNFPRLFINHFCSISKITFPAKFELPDTSKIFLKLTTVFSFVIWLIFKTSTVVAVSQSFHQACFSDLFSNYSRINLEQTASLEIIHKCGVPKQCRCALLAPNPSTGNS